MPMTATHHFRLPGLWAEASVLGQSRTLTYAGRSCALRLPASRTDFGIEEADWDHHALGGYVQSKGSDEYVRAAVLMVRVDVEMDGELTADQAPPGGPIAPEVQEEAQRILEESADVARGLVSSLVAWSRTELGQHWLEPEQQAPRVTWISSLRDADGQRLAIGYSDPSVVTGIGLGRTGMNAEELDRIVERARAGRLPGLAETLLADAQFYAWSAAEPRLELGLLLAAVACEVKVKRFLSDSAKADQQELVDLVLENPRDFSVAAAALFDKGVHATVGQSLREADRDLYKAITRLFEDRNRFAHRGVTGFDKGQVRNHLRAAAEVFRWLDGLQAS